MIESGDAEFTVGVFLNAFYSGEGGRSPDQKIRRDAARATADFAGEIFTGIYDILRSPLRMASDMDLTKQHLHKIRFPITQ